MWLNNLEQEKSAYKEVSGVFWVFFLIFSLYYKGDALGYNTGGET